MIAEEPEYRGPFVVIEPDPIGYRVSIDPPPPGDDLTRTFREKSDAWRYASDWWSVLGCPLRDLTDSNVAREPQTGPRGKSRSFL